MSNYVVSVPVPSAIAAGASVSTVAMGAKMIQLTGTFVGTVQFQGSLDGVTWVSEGAALTAPGAYEVTKRWAYMRANVTAYTSGTPLAYVCGGSV